MSFLQRIVRAIRVRLDSRIALATARRDSKARLDRRRGSRLLIICYGNIYRSAFVGELLRDRLGSTYEIRSRGFHPVAGRPSPERHVEICKRHGVSLESHRSSITTAADVDWADFIVLMDRHNRIALQDLGADEDKLVWLGSFVEGPVEIVDPYTLDDRGAERIVERLRNATERLVEQLQAKAADRWDRSIR